MISFSPVILHVDMDAFFAAIEMRNNPHLLGRPVMVGGGIGSRGVVSTCSYEAREYGVHSGMPISEAVRRCPHGVFISAGLKGYVYASACLQEIFQRYSPIVEPFSVDEAFLDITGTYHLHGGPEALVARMKAEIQTEMKLTCSVGIAPGKYLAKMASGLNKPNGTTIMDHDRFREYFYDKPVDSLWGVGESTARSLNKTGIMTVGDLAAARTDILKRLFGKPGETMSIMARGCENSDVLRYDDLPHDKSMSHETTVDKDLQDPSHIKATVLWLADKVARRLRRGGYIGRTISVKIRSSGFKTITRSHTITIPTDRCDIIFRHALKLIPKEYGLKTRVRLLGVRVSHLKKYREKGVANDNLVHDKLHPEQLEMPLMPQEKSYAELTRAVDSIRDKYGEYSIRLAGTMLHN